VGAGIGGGVDGEHQVLQAQDRGKAGRGVAAAGDRVTVAAVDRAGEDAVVDHLDELAGVEAVALEQRDRLS
jgi:hypothetical protein